MENQKKPQLIRLSKTPKTNPRNYKLLTNCQSRDKYRVFFLTGHP